MGTTLQYTVSSHLYHCLLHNFQELIKLNSDYSHLVGQCLERFIQSKDLRPDFVASHGHTVFHQPDKGITFQLGEGEIISTYIRYLT